MYDGVVLYTTPSLTAVLGFPKDMWIGRSFGLHTPERQRHIFKPNKQHHHSSVN